MPRSLPIMLAPLALLLPVPGQAQTAFQDTRQIDAAVAGFTGRPVGAEGGARTPVDPRLRLAACPMVSMNWYGAAHDAVVVRCTEPEWRIFVPIVAAPPAPFVPAPAPVVAAKPAIVIKRGDPVTIEVNASGFSVTRDGVAMTDAAPGARFLVDVDGTKKPVQAIALESGRATLPGWAQ
jgi:flagella basal body P-ring formation protein FlgA